MAVRSAFLAIANMPREIASVRNKPIHPLLETVQLRDSAFVQQLNGDQGQKTNQRASA